VTVVMITPRSSDPLVRNPLLAMASARGCDSMPVEARNWLAAMLADLSRDSAQRAQKAWRTHKAPMALYWKVVAVYARHLAKVLKSDPIRESGAETPAPSTASVSGSVGRGSIPTSKLDPGVQNHE
jgi:hypothetical protein